MDPAYLFAAGIGGAIWAVFFAVRSDLRRIMLLMSLLGLPLAFSDLFYVPQYWRPHTIDHIPVGIEGLLFSFEAAGICAVVYPVIFRKYLAPGSRGDIHVPNLSLRPIIAILLPLPVSAAISLGLGVNLEWGLYAGLIVAGIFAVWIRPDLRECQVLSAVAFLPIYTAALILWLALFPEVHNWFTLRGMPHWYVLNVPLTEIVFGALFAAYWSCLYPIVFERHFEDRSTFEGTLPTSDWQPNE